MLAGDRCILSPVGIEPKQLNLSRIQSALPLVLSVSSFCFGAACSSRAGSVDVEQEAVCPREQPTFRVRLADEIRPLPLGLTVVAQFGGVSSETFVLAEASESEEGDPSGSDNTALCCRQLYPMDVLEPATPLVCNSSSQGVIRHTPTDAGPAVTAPSLVVCDIWANGAATLTVDFPGGEPIERVLEAEPSEDPALARCGVFDFQQVTLRLGSVGGTD